MSSPPISGDQNKFDYPKATLLCRPNSHLFQERTLNLSQPVKIGRSVARDRVMPTNAIFECKVLSRNHALLWYENGKFFLQDTKSSNGTFVNNQRLSLGGDESQPHEVCSGDIVQFGVDVIENTKKVTHGCIIATLKLYLPDGTEAKCSQIAAITQPGVGNVGSVSAVELYQLNQYIQEATRREQQLEGKLGHLQKIVESTKHLAQQAWHCLLQEDLLLTRIDTLESQLKVYMKNADEDKIRLEMVQLLDDKLKYQQAAKESLRRAVEEKLAAAQRCSTLEIALCSAEEEKDNTQRALDRANDELQELAAQVIASQGRIKDLQSQCEKLEQLRTQYSVLKIQLHQWRHKETICQTKLLCSQAKLSIYEDESNMRNNLINEAKSEGDVLDNEFYQNNHDSLISKMDAQIDHLQRRLIELTTVKNGTISGDSKKSSSDVSELSDDGNMTIIDNIEDESTIRLSNHSSDEMNKRNNSRHSDIPPSLDIFRNTISTNSDIGGNPFIDQTSTNPDLDNNRDMEEGLDNTQWMDTVEQISNALLELRAQREILVTHQQRRKEKLKEYSEINTDINNSVINDNDLKPKHISVKFESPISDGPEDSLSPIKSPVEWLTENEKLRDELECCRSQLHVYETEIVNLNHKLETLGIELETRPSHNSLQEKETLCFTQRAELDKITVERDALLTRLDERAQRERELQEKLQAAGDKSHSLEKLVADLGRRIEEKDESLERLKDEMMTNTVIEKVMSNVNISSQTESVISEVTAITGNEETQTPSKEYKDFENSVQKDFEFLSDPVVELQEELMSIKESFANTSAKNKSLTDQIEKLQMDYDSAMRQSRTMIYVYIAPLLALVFYMLLSPYMSQETH